MGFKSLSMGEEDFKAAKNRYAKLSERCDVLVGGMVDGDLVDALNYLDEVRLYVWDVEEGKIMCVWRL